MPRTLDDDPEGQEEDDDFGAGEADYAPEADEAGELWCPKCGAVMYADASLCPACDEYVKPGLPPRQGLPRWMWIAGLLLFLLALAAVIFQRV